MPFLHRDGVALYHELSRGDAAPVVLIHGWCCDHRHMAPLAQHSRRAYFDKSNGQHQDDIRRASEKLVTDPDVLERVVRWGLTSDRRTTADVMAEVMVTDLRGDLQNIKAPVDVIYAWDKVSPASKMGLDQVYASSYSGLTQGRRRRIDDARHYVMFDQPAAFYGEMKAWLAR